MAAPKKPLATIELVDYLDAFLETHRYPDASNNGLQVQGASALSRVAFAVDACLATFRAAAKARAQLLIVHHGLFWSEHIQIAGAQHARIKALFDAGLGLYASHIPLDAHAEVGNNAQLARIVGLGDVAPWGVYKGQSIGCIGTLPKATPLASLDRTLRRAIGTGGAGGRVMGVRPAQRVAICSGFGLTFLNDAVAAGADTLITGETSHQWHHPVLESGINVIFGGHYNSETVGVRALQAHLAGRFSIDTVFIDQPTGL